MANLKIITGFIWIGIAVVSLICLVVTHRDDYWTQVLIAAGVGTILLHLETKGGLK